MIEGEVGRSKRGGIAVADASGGGKTRDAIGGESSGSPEGEFSASVKGELSASVEDEVGSSLEVGSSAEIMWDIQVVGTQIANPHQGEQVGHQPGGAAPMES